MKDSRTETERTRSRYDRLAFIYDAMEAPVERMRFVKWRARLRERILGERALEVGVGTGKNMLYYPPGLEIKAIDISPRMIGRALKRSQGLSLELEIREMDVQDLNFPDDSFDTVFATFVFCSVPDPVQGLRELHRVCRPAGRLLLLEHMRPENPVLARIFDLLNPFVVRLMGANINRRTVENIQRAGWKVQVEDHLASDIVRWLEATP